MSVSSLKTTHFRAISNTLHIFVVYLYHFKNTRKNPMLCFLVEHIDDAMVAYHVCSQF